MKNWKVISMLIAVSAASQPLLAWSSGHRADDFVIEAPVTRVEPLVSIVNVRTPQEVCWEEPVYQSANRQRSKTPTVIGGILGGVLGNGLTRDRSSRSRNLATAAGVLLGASLGRDHAQRRQAPASRYVTSQRICEIEQVMHQEERIDGYRVTYQYRGRQFVTQTVADPGSTIRVRVQVEPLAYNGDQRYGPAISRRPFRNKRFES